MNRMNHTFPLDLLSEGSKRTTFDGKAVEDMKQLILNAFKENGIVMSDISYIAGPTVVRFELIPERACKLKHIRSCEDKLNEALSEYGPIRLIAPVLGKGTIAVEVPRLDRQLVWLRGVIESKEFQESGAHLPIALGIDYENNIAVADLAKMPHLLIADATGQGKSVLLNNIILSLLYRLSPDDLKLVLIDPKHVEFNHYNRIKKQYLLRTSEEDPAVITAIEKVPEILISIVNEVRKRYDLLIQTQCRTIREYNHKIADGKLPKDKHHHQPNIVVVIDEFADLMNVCGGNFMMPLARIAQKSRAIGIHLVIATQRLSTDVITGIIKPNFRARIAFRVMSDADSKTVLDISGAKKLLGKGDMLFNYCSDFKRIQSCYIGTPEIESICEWIAQHCPTDFSYVLSIIYPSDTPYEAISERDPLFLEAAHSIVTSNNSPINFKPIIDLLMSDDEDKDDDDSNFTKDTVMGKDDDKMEAVDFTDLLDTYEFIEKPYRFPYENYKIIGDTAEIDKIIYTCGYMNIDVRDIEKTLSNETTNYVITGSAEGTGCIVNALKDAVSKLPIAIDRIADLLFNIWMPKTMDSPLKELNSMTDFIGELSGDFDCFWGVAYDDESLNGQQAKITLIAASK